MNRFTFDVAISIYMNFLFGWHKGAHLTEVRTKVSSKEISRNIGMGNVRLFYCPSYLHLVIKCNPSWFKSVPHPRWVHAKFPMV